MQLFNMTRKVGKVLHHSPSLLMPLMGSEDIPNPLNCAGTLDYGALSGQLWVD